jgi:hypothetical protein
MDVGKGNTIGDVMPLPPDKFVAAGSLSGLTPTNAAIALSDAYQTFYTNFGVWPTVALIDGNDEVYLGAY